MITTNSRDMVDSSRDVRETLCCFRRLAKSFNADSAEAVIMKCTPIVAHVAEKVIEHRFSGIPSILQEKSLRAQVNQLSLQSVQKQELPGQPNLENALGAWELDTRVATNQVMKAPAKRPMSAIKRSPTHKGICKVGSWQVVRSLITEAMRRASCSVFSICCCLPYLAASCLNRLNGELGQSHG